MHSRCDGEIEANLGVEASDSSTGNTCSGIPAVLQLIYSSLPSGKFEFHAEWLRDEPFDATTTGQNKGVPVSTLSWKQGT
jgi:hypothetical protein